MRSIKMNTGMIIVLSFVIIASGCVSCLPTSQKTTITPTAQVIVMTAPPTATPLPDNGTVDIAGNISGNYNANPTKIVQGYVYIDGVPQQSIPVEINTAYKTIIPTDSKGYFYYVAGHEGENASNSYTIAILDKNWNPVYEDNTPRPYDGKILNISLTTT